MRRKRGSGGLCRASGRWVGRVEVKKQDGKRRRREVADRLFCHALRKFSSMHPYRPEYGDPTRHLPRIDAMRAARERGSHTDAEWFALVRSVRRRCAYCGCETRPVGEWRLTMDHIVPVSRGGSDAIENLCVACAGCNSDKGTMTGDEYRAWRAGAA